MLEGMNFQSESLNVKHQDSLSKLEIEVRKIIIFKITDAIIQTLFK